MGSAGPILSTDRDGAERLDRSTYGQNRSRASNRREGHLLEEATQGQADRAQTIHRPARRGLARNPKLDMGRETGGPESDRRSAAEPETGCGLAPSICSFSSLPRQGKKKRLGTGFVRAKMAVR